jgi:hypothetical protein
MAKEDSGLGLELEAKIIAAIEKSDVVAFNALLQEGFDLMRR